MKWRKLFGWKWFLPMVTMLIVLTAIVLPERLSALGDRKLFVAAHVEPFDSAQGIAAPGMTLEQRLRSFIALNFGEPTDTYVRYEETFSEEEIKTMDGMFQDCIQKLVDSGEFTWLYELTVSGLEYYDTQRAYIWDGVTMGNASFAQLSCYNGKQDVVINLTIDEESGAPFSLTVVSSSLETLFVEEKGSELVKLAASFTKPLGFTVLDSIYYGDDAYVVLQGEEGELYYHISQKYGVLTVEPISKEAMGYVTYDAEASTSIVVGEDAYDA